MLDGVVLGLQRVADAREEVGYRIGDGHRHVSLPARLRQAGDVALVGQLAQADPAEAELAEVRARAAAALAAVVVAGLVLRRARAGAPPVRSWPCPSSPRRPPARRRPGLAARRSRRPRRSAGCSYASGFSSFSCSSAACSASACRRSFSSPAAPGATCPRGAAAPARNGMPNVSSSAKASSSVVRGGGDGHVEAAHLVDRVVVDLREDDLLADAHRVVAAAVERARVEAAEVADSRDRDRQQAVEELVHARVAQRHGHADGHLLAQLEVGDRLAGAADVRLLAGDRRRAAPGRPRASSSPAWRRRRPCSRVIFVICGACIELA